MLINVDNEVVFAQDFSVTGNLNSLKDYWDKLTAIGPKYGYFPKPTKSYLIAKKNKLMKAKNLFANSRMNITAAGKRHHGAVVESTEYRNYSLSYQAGTVDWPFQYFMKQRKLNL